MKKLINYMCLALSMLMLGLTACSAPSENAEGRTDGACKQSIVHGGYLYFVSSAYERVPFDPTRYGVQYICKMKLDGSAFQTIYQSAQYNDDGFYTISDIYGIAIYGNELYYADQEAVGRMTLDGEILQTYENTRSDFMTVRPFYIHNGAIYYISIDPLGIEGGTRHLFRMNMDGTDVRLLQTAATEFTIDEQNERAICFVTGFNEDPEKPQTESIVQMSLDGEDKTVLAQYPVEWGGTRGNGEDYWRTFLDRPIVIDGDIHYIYRQYAGNKSYCLSQEPGAKPVEQNDLAGLTEEQVQLFADKPEQVSRIGMTDSHIFFTRETQEHIHLDDDSDGLNYIDAFTYKLYEMDRSSNEERLLYEMDHMDDARSFWLGYDLMHIDDDCLYFDGVIVRRDGTGLYYAASENGAMTYVELGE